MFIFILAIGLLSAGGNSLNSDYAWCKKSKFRYKICKEEKFLKNLYVPKK